jgi:ribonuclease VapC
VSADTPVYILDSFALLAYFQGEKGLSRVKMVLQQADRSACRACISLINLGEVAYITEREQGLSQAQAILAVVDELTIQVLPATRQAVLDAAHIKANYPLAYADAFAVVAAQAEKGVLLTGDPEMEAVEGLVPLEWLSTEMR